MLRNTQSNLNYDTTHETRLLHTIHITRCIHLFIEVQSIIDCCRHVSGHLRPGDEVASSVSTRMFLEGWRCLRDDDDLLNVLVIHLIIFRGV